MKNLTKVAALVLALVFALSMMTACGGTGKETTAEAEAPAVNDGTGSVLRVAMECSYAPYNWTQSDDTNGALPIANSADYAYGYDVMIAKYIGEKLGMTVEIYKLDWDSLPMAVQAGTVDCVIAGQSITSERLEMVDFSNPYYYATAVALCKNTSSYAGAKSIADLAGAKASAQISSIHYEICIPQIPDVQRQTAMEEMAQLYVAVEAGSLDICVVDKPTGLAAAMVYQDFTVLDFSGTDGDFELSDEEVNIGISLQKGNSGLLTKINEALSGLSTDDFNRMMEEAIAIQPLNN